MDIVIIVLLVVMLVAMAIMVFFMIRRKQSGGNTENLDKLVEKTVDNVMAKQMKEFVKELGDNNQKSQENLTKFELQTQEFLSKRIEALNKQLDEKILLLDKRVDEKLDKGFKGTSESMAQVRERLQAIDDAQKQMEGLGKQVVSLKQVLEGNQTRGQYGEYQLSMVLHNIFGDTIGTYEEQYTLRKAKDGDSVRADAVVFMPEPNKLICIDSKFPFQDYRRLFEAESEEEKASLTKEFGNAVKKHITTIKDKYIIENKTAPEALMFIPNDGVFAFVHHELQDVVEYARQQRVVITSPSTLPAILVTINMVRIDAERAKHAKELSKHLSKLGKDFEMFGREWESLSKQLESATKSREKLDSRVSRITGKFDSLSAAELLDEPSEIKEIEAPSNEE